MNEVIKVENKIGTGLELVSHTEQNPLITKIGRQIWGILEGKKRDIYDIGRLLSQAKNTFIAHGQFIPWIKETFGDELPYSTVWNYMKMYETFEGKPEMIQC